MKNTSSIGPVFWLVVLGVLFVATFSAFRALASWEIVQGNEAYVLQHITDGVTDEVWRDGTHFYQGWKYDVFKYNIGTQKITFEDNNQEAEYGSIAVNVGEGGGQQVKISLSANYRLGHTATPTGPVYSPEKIVAMHKDGLHKNYEDVILRRTIVEVVNRIARPKNALEIYSGVGYNQFVKEVEDALISHEVFRERGILIENLIVNDVSLNPAYEAEIEAKQLAIQKALREKEERRAAEEGALRAKAQAETEVQTRTQKAEAAKQERIKAAEAEKQEQVLRAQGEQEANIAKATGTLAIGKAEAEVDMLKREALYGGSAGALRAKVEVQKYQAEQLKGILEGFKGFMTDKSFTAITGNVLQPVLNMDAE